MIPLNHYFSSGLFMCHWDFHFHEVVMIYFLIYNSNPSHITYTIWQGPIFGNYVTEEPLRICKASQQILMMTMGKSRAEYLCLFRK